MFYGHLKSFKKYDIWFKMVIIVKTKFARPVLFQKVSRNSLVLDCAAQILRIFLMMIIQHITDIPASKTRTLWTMMSASSSKETIPSLPDARRGTIGRFISDSMKE